MHTSHPTAPLLVRRARLVPVGRPARTREPVDLRIRDGVVTHVADTLAPEGGERVVDADGRWAVPGLWDAHVHLQQWARTLGRLDVGGATAPEQVTAAVAEHVAHLPTAVPTVVLGYGQRTATWARQPTVAELDAVSGPHPVALISGDAHHGWLNSRALEVLGVPARPGPLEEAEWFAVLPRLDELGASEDSAQALRTAVRDAAAKGVVGLVDVEWEDGHRLWPARVAQGADLLRVRTATYPDDLDGVLSAGLRTGDAVPGGGGLVTMGPLKVIFDGSLNTRTAWCCEPYGGDGTWRGTLNLSPDELTALCARAHAGGLQVAVHAIGDAAVGAALDAVERSGARGSIEHVQLVARRDLPRFAALGVAASVQPAHLLDDRDVTEHVWPDRVDRAFALRSLLLAGAELRLGSDAPVAPLDPWLAMAAAVHRSADARPAWTAGEALTPAEALRASTDGQTTLAEGSRGDLALLDDDPLAAKTDAASAAARLRAMQVALTVVAGRVTHGSL